MATEITVVEARGEEETFEDELWEFDDPRGRMRTLTNATGEADGSDFIPAQLEMMKRNTTTEVAPLPRGVRHVQWQPPRETGLEHSAPIFETEAGVAGGSCVTTKRINKNNCHCRSWQENNGVAETFAVKSVEKDVDGETRTVLISPGISMRTSARSVMAVIASDLKSMVRSSPTNSSAEESGDEGQNAEGRRAVACAMSSPTDEPKKDTPSFPRHPSEDAVNEATNGKHHSGSNTSEGSLTCGKNVSESSCPSTTGLTDDVISPTPRRPSGSSASCHRQRPSPGRSLSEKDIIDDTSTLALEKKERVVHGVRRPSHATLSRGECDLEAVVEGGCCIGASCPRDVTETGKYAASSTLWTAGEVGDSDVGREATTVGAVQGDRGGRDRQGEGEYTNVAARQKQGFDPSDEGSRRTTKSWWSGRQAPREVSREESQRPHQELIQGQQHCSQERPEHQAKEGVVPSVPETTGNSRAVPQGRRWLIFRRRTPRDSA